MKFGTHLPPITTSGPIIDLKYPFLSYYEFSRHYVMVTHWDTTSFYNQPMYVGYILTLTDLTYYPCHYRNLDLVFCK